MTQKDNLIERLRSHPRDFTFAEAQTLLGYLGFRWTNKGKTSGSRVLFLRSKNKIVLHRPHPDGQLKPYQIRQLIDTLESKGLI